MIYKVLILVLLILGLKAFQNTHQSQDEDIAQKQYTPYSPELAKQLCAYSIAAYCPVKKIENWSCGKPCRQYNDIQDIKIIYNKDTQIKLFLGYTQSINSIIVSFRGSLSMENFRQDLEWDFVDYPYCEGCKVEKGWNTGYLSVQEELLNSITQYQQKYPNAQLAITGHSLGAVITNWLAGDLIMQGQKDFIWYNYGSPKAGNLEFVTWITKQYNERQFKVVHANDLAAHVPAAEGYIPTPQEVFYPDSSEPDAKHIICSMYTEDPQCSSQYSLDQTNMNIHLDYMGYNFFNIISLCLL